MSQTFPPPAAASSVLPPCPHHPPPNELETIWCRTCGALRPLGGELTYDPTCARAFAAEARIADLEKRIVELDDLRGLLSADARLSALEAHVRELQTKIALRA